MVFKRISESIKKLFRGKEKEPPKVIEVEIPREDIDIIMKDFKKELRNRMKSL